MAGPGPRAWDGFGWGVAPGTVVRLQVETGNLDVVLTKIGEALGGLGSRAATLGPRLDGHDEAMGSLTGGVDGLLAFCAILERTPAAAQQQGVGPAPAAAPTGDSELLAALRAPSEEIAALRVRYEEMAARLQALEDGGGAAEREAAAWAARAAALGARCRGLAGAIDAAKARLRAWRDDVVADIVAGRGAAGGGESANVIGAALEEYANMDADVMPLARGLATALALAREEAASLAAGAAALGGPGDDGGAAEAGDAARGSELAALEASLIAAAAGVAAVGESAEQGRGALLRACVAAATVHRLTYTDLALRAAVVDVDTRAHAYAARRPGDLPSRICLREGMRD